MFFSKLAQNYREAFGSRQFVISFCFSLGMLISCFVINLYAALYATASASSSVTDIVLSNTRAYDMDGFFVNGAFAMVVLIVFVLAADPKRVPFAVKTISLFVIIRSIFITLTHIGPFPTQAVIDPHTGLFIQELIGQKLFASFFTGNDLFFSGHTGLPFLMAFVYFDKKVLRILFIILSILFGTIVLLAHLHYTIDVLSAFFIVFGIYRISRALFRHDLVPEQIRCD